ncbi:hypothetical protein ACS0TY_035052 [Phlomoides rotata]
MSIRKKPELAVPLLLARLEKAKEHALRTEEENEIQSNLFSKFDDFKTKLESMKNVFPDIKSWEKTVMDQFCALEQELDDDVFKNSEMKYKVEGKLEHMEKCIDDLKELIPKVDKRISKVRGITFKSRQVSGDDHHQTPVFPEWVDLGVDNKLLDSKAMWSFLGGFHFLSGSEQAKMCSLCLSVFPRNSTIEKKPLIYWWMGEGLVMKSPNKTAEEVGEQVFQELLDEGFIRASRENKSLSVSSFDVDPWIHRLLIKMADQHSFSNFSPQWTPCNGKRRAFLWQENNNKSRSRRISEEKEAENVIMVLNVDEQYLRKKPEWLSKLRKVEVLHMGRWQNSDTHHIEVDDQTLLNDLGSQKHLRYLSLRGISRIETLPASISKLTSLQILDLRACHNLEKLPPTISRLKNLTHLDVSHCYLLESMPKGLEHLLALQVVKGFVLGKAEKNSCKISDLARLKDLKKLSIRVDNQGGTQQDDQLASLDALPALRILTISWGDVSSVQVNAISLPPTLTKLDLRCVPFESVPDWLSPSKLPLDLTKLYIKGGRLNSLDGHVWKVNYLRFKYLEGLKINKGDLPNYEYLDQSGCYEFRPDITSTTAAEIVDQPIAKTEIEELQPKQQPKRTLK